MNALLFPSNKSVELTFKVGIAGTSASPSRVAVVLEREAKQLSFTAKKEGDSWTAMIDSPGSIFGLGEVKLSVNVVLNNHLFTPLKSSAEIIEASNLPQTEPSIEEVPAIAPFTPAAPPTVTLPLMQTVQSVQLKIEEPIKLSLLRTLEKPAVSKFPVKESAVQVRESGGSTFKIKKIRTVFK